MAITLPEGAATLETETDETDDSKTVEKANKSYFERLKDLPENLYEAFTGGNVPVEFPNIPEASEMTDQAPGFIEGLIPNLKIIMARDDVGKTEIMEKSFKDDPRWGGAFQDKFGHPIIVWNNQPYYVNKPGVSGQDFGTFVGEIIKYIPATKIVSKAKTLLGTVKAGIPAYSATEMGSQALETALTPDTTKKKSKSYEDMAEEVGAATALNVGVDLALPPILKGAKTLAKGALKTADKTFSFPEFDPSIIKTSEEVQTSKYDLTSGQREGPAPGTSSTATEQLEREDLFRRAASVDREAGYLIKGFDEAQLDAIKSDAQILQSEIGSGKKITDLNQTDVSGVAGEEIQSILSAEASSIKKKAGELYESVSKSSEQPIMNAEGVLTSSREAISKILIEMGVTARELARMPILKSELDFLANRIKIASKKNFKGLPLSELHGYQKSLNRAFRSAEPGSPEQLALGKIKESIDNSVFDGIERGFIEGDELVIESLKDATDLYRQYIGLTGKSTGKDAQEKAANKILAMLTNRNYTPRQVANSLFGHNKFAPNQSVPLVIDKLKNILPEQQFAEISGLLKDAIIEKAFSGSGKSGVTRTNIVNNFDEVFIKQRAVINKLFSSDEIAKIKQFKENVLPTLWAEIKLNPSGTGYLLLSALTRSNILNFTRAVPIVGESTVSMIEGVAQRSEALDMIRQYIARGNQPLLSSAISSAARPEVVETISEVESPSLNAIIKTLDAEKIEKIINSNAE
jgi:hypothetical protein